MNCRFCNADTKVVDKRESADDVTRRRRECLKCERRFTTYERVENSDFVVTKKDGRREKFSREKLTKGLVRACEKRPIAMEKIDAVVDAIESEIRKKDLKEITSKRIGEMVIRKLRSLDKVAYIRFASVYREFEDVHMFEEELKKLVK